MATSMTMDGVTAGAIKQALAAAARGRLDEACAVGERALASGGDVAALNAMLGMFRLRSGNPERASRHLELAHTARPADPVIAQNLAETLVQLEKHEDALKVLTEDMVSAAPGTQLLKLRGFAAQMSDQFELAIRCYEKVVEAEPNDCEMWNNLGNSYRSAEQPEKAVEALRRATELDPTSPPIRLNYANALIAIGDWDAAERELNEIAAAFPEDPNPLRQLYGMYKDEGRDEEALEAMKEAVRRAPDDIDLLLGLAADLSATLKSDEAEATYRHVLEVDPKNAMGYLGVAFCMELTNRTDDLSALVSEVEAKEIDRNAINFIRAFDFRRRKRFAEGLEALEQVPADLESSRRAHLMAQLLEGVGRYDDAFEYYEKMNELRSAEGPPPEPRAERYRTILRNRIAGTTEAWASQWRIESDRDPRRSPVFLVGFPRSGTTLLDTMLMGHPAIEVLEEEPMLREAFEIFKDHDALPTATDEQIKAARDSYFKTAAKLTPLTPGSLLVDKNPLAMNALPVIRRIFPDAKVILALRHPCDVVLSCYVTNFKLNDGMSSFTHLDTAAELYDLSFTYFERSQALLPMPCHTVVYEKVVADRDRQLRDLFDFLEMDWHDAVLDHQSTALKRGRIKTASYAQVAEPIYDRSAGRWQHYRKHLEPIFPVLKPWIDKFGYEL